MLSDIWKLIMRPIVRENFRPICLIALLGIISESRSFAQREIPYDSLKVVLEHLYDRDQGIRKKVVSASGGEFGKLICEMQTVDSLNRLQIKEILAHYGWLPTSKMGEKASDAIFYAVQHAEIELMKSYLPHLRKLARKKEAKRTHAAMMEDRILMYDGKKQRYGTQATSLGPGNLSFVWPIERPGKVNSLRKKAGFDLTVEENAKRMDAIYNPDEKLPDIKMK